MLYAKELAPNLDAIWIHKGMYGNGTALAPFMPLYECLNCKALSVEQFDECPECHSSMKKEGDSDDGNGRLSGTS